MSDVGQSAAGIVLICRKGNWEKIRYEYLDLQSTCEPRAREKSRTRAANATKKVNSNKMNGPADDIDRFVVVISSCFVIKTWPTHDVIFN